MLFRVLFIAVLLSGCSREILYGRREIIGKDILASSYVHTPDPEQEKDWKGEKLVFGWALPSSYQLTGKEYLQVRVIYANLEFEEFKFCIRHTSGVKEVYLIGEAFKQRKGFATYNLKLMNGDTLVKEWKHQLWAEPVVFHTDEEG